jgi:DNA-binding transcriptional LysR family regulator
MVRLGLGLSVVPLWAVDEDLKQGHLSVIRQREPPLINSFTLLSRSAGHLVGPVNAFVELAKTFVWKRPHMIFSGGKLPQVAD